jgi:hypothetical protein
VTKFTELVPQKWPNITHICCTNSPEKSHSLFQGTSNTHSTKLEADGDPETTKYLQNMQSSSGVCQLLYFGPKLAQLAANCTCAEEAPSVAFAIISAGKKRPLTDEKKS